VPLYCVQLLKLSRSPYHCHKFLISLLCYKRKELIDVEFNVAAIFCLILCANIGYTQCSGSGSAGIRINFGPLDPDPHWEYGSAIRNINTDPQYWIHRVGFLSGIFSPDRDDF
jgi:hypothetical protein